MRMPMPAGYKQTDTEFFRKWGEQARDIAEREGTTIEAIHMRCHKNGSPYVRKAKPSKFERKYSKTLQEICAETESPPPTIYTYEQRNGDAYYVQPYPRPSMRNPWDYTPDRGKNTWLMEDHPDYLDWRNGKLFPDEYVQRGRPWQEVEKLVKEHNNKT